MEANVGRDTNYDPVDCGSTIGDCPITPLLPGPGKSRFAQVSATFRPEPRSDRRKHFFLLLSA